MSTISEKTYTTIQIPKSSDTFHLNLLAKKFRQFKLDALQSAPEAFPAEFDTESQLPQSAWLKRITERSTTILICVATDTHVDEDTSTHRNRQLSILLDGEWTGMFTLIGPVSREDYFWPESGQPEPGPDGSETRWQLTSLFTMPAYRGCGIAKRLTDAAIDFGKLASSEMGKVSGRVVRTRIRLVVHPKNIGVVRMYEKFGFKDSARMTAAEACVANGAADMVPKDADPEKWHSRFGVAMEIFV